MKRVTYFVSTDMAGSSVSEIVEHEDDVCDEQLQEELEDWASSKISMDFETIEDVPEDNEDDEATRRVRFTVSTDMVGSSVSEDFDLEVYLDDDDIQERLEDWAWQKVSMHYEVSE